MTPSTGKVSDAEPQVRRYLDNLIVRGETPGLQYLFLTTDAVLYAHYAGMADFAADHPVTGRTTFNAYSVTKTFTAAAVLQLAEAGKVDLDQPLARYVERFPYGRSPTLRETLCHTGGFPNPIPIAWVHRAEEHASFDQRRFMDELLDRHSNLISAPGESYAYSNLGYLLLGEVIGNVAGLTCTDYIERHLIGPLSLDADATLAFTIAQPQDHARGYIKRWSLLNGLLGFFLDRRRYIDKRCGRWLQLHDHYVNGAAYGGLIGNAHGFARYLQALLGANDYLTSSVRTQLFAPAHARNARALPRSLGWFIGSLDGEVYYTHAGGGAGYYCEIRLYPRRARASVLMFNRSGIRDERLLDRFDSLFLRQHPPPRGL
jgi:CubicO group peptidase (beta-lactamase class C family)